MKEKIHPKFFPKAKVVCACGNKFFVGSTQEEIHTEICSACHPFYTGKQNLVDTAGRVERFEKLITTHKNTVEKLRGKKKKEKTKTKTVTGLDNKTKLKQIKKKLDAK